MNAILILTIVGLLIGGWKRFSDRKATLTRYLTARRPAISQKRRVEEGL